MLFLENVLPLHTKNWAPGIFYDYNIITKAGFEITWFPTVPSIQIMMVTSLLVNRNGHITS